MYRFENNVVVNNYACKRSVELWVLGLQRNCCLESAGLKAGRQSVDVAANVMFSYLNELLPHGTPSL